MSEQTRPRFTIEVEPMDDEPNAGRRLARIVKTLGRQYGFRCVAVAEAAGDQVEGENEPQTKRSNDHGKG